MPAGARAIPLACGGVNGALRGGRFTASSMFACNHAALERLLGLIVPGRAGGLPANTHVLRLWVSRSGWAV